MSPNWWTVPRMWEGQTVVVMASGAGMTVEIAETVRGLPTIAINSTYRLAPWASMLYAADVEWWQNNPAALSVPGIKVCCIADVKKPRIVGVNCLRMTGTRGIEDQPGGIRTGSNSGYQAVHVAYSAGASRILLCGYNMGGPNWHGKHPTPLRNTTDSVYGTWRRLFMELVAELGKRGVTVTNCTPNSSLPMPVVPLEEALEAIHGSRCIVP